MWSTLRPALFASLNGTYSLCSTVIFKMQRNHNGGGVYRKDRSMKIPFE